MASLYHDVVCGKLRYVQGWSIRRNYLLCLTLGSWIASSAVEGLQSNCTATLKDSGIIISPNYPLNYTNNLNCTWHLQTSSNASSIRLQFYNFNTEYHFDVLLIYDEKGFMTAFSGNTLPPIMTLGRAALLVFSTDGSVNKTGFSATFTTFDITNRSRCTTNDVYWCINSSKCVSRYWRCDQQYDCSLGEDEAGCLVTSLQPNSSHFAKGSGVILSPNYPLNYTNNANTTWCLESSSNATSIRLHFYHFNTKFWDELRIYDEKGLVTMFTGYTLPPFMTLGKSARLIFTTDISYNSTGFNASFSSFDITNRTQCITSDVYWCTISSKCISRRWICDRQLDCFLGEDEAGCLAASTKSNSTALLNASGIIISPNYPLNYGKNNSCMWLLRSSSNYTYIRLQFNHFDLGYGPNELRIYDEKGDITRFYGYTLPPVMTLGRTARLVFSASSEFTSSGISAFFTSFDIMSRTQCTTNDVFWCTNSTKCISVSWRCDGQRDCFFGEDEAGCPTTTLAPPTPPPCRGTVVDSGYIQSPNYPQDYPNNARCSWRLLSKSNDTRIRLQFTAFNLENSYDYVDVYDERKIGKRYTGNVLPPTMSLGKDGVVEFYSDHSQVMKGFRAQFESINVTSGNQCMTSDTFWCFSDRKCISSSWRCDGYPDCPSRDDELLCQTTAQITLSPENYCLLQGRFWCSRSHQCVPVSYRCDYYEDCSYGEDETDCSLSSLSSQSYCQIIWYGNSNGYFYCRKSGKCISASSRCNYYKDCQYGEDEYNCLRTTISPQNDCHRIGHFWCDRSRNCVPSSYRCDNRRDCTYGEDEANCLQTTLSPQSTCQRYGSFWCIKSQKCVPMSYRCDYSDDCSHGEDEANCSNASQQHCQQAHRFWCEFSRECINLMWRCDRTDDCHYGEDEQGCGYLSSGTIAAIVVGSVIGVVILIVLATGIRRAMKIRKERRPTESCNNSLQTAARQSATVWPPPATYGAQFGAPCGMVGGAQETGGLPMDQYAPPSYDATMKAYATGQYANTRAQGGGIRAS